MEITYHYPPELINLLIDVIPLLSRSKKDVLLFFKGAGVEHTLFYDLEQKVLKDRESISKFEISRTILSRLNDRGEATLRERREVLKRISEFEDFSSCWPNDQLKAKGLVSEIRRVINVKDSFTRMKLEREKELQKNQAEHLARIKSIQEKRDENANIKAELYSLFSIPEEGSQKRGKLLESVLNRLFKAHNILIKEAFEIKGVEKEGIIEQIDGVVEIGNFLYLVEMKWWKEPLGVSEVSPHLVRVFNRGHAGGIIISKSGFSAPAISTVKEALSQKIVILCELEEIIKLLESENCLLDLFTRKIQSAAIVKNPFSKPFA